MSQELVMQWRLPATRSREQAYARSQSWQSEFESKSALVRLVFQLGLLEKPWAVSSAELL